jgi:hypothetical protein
MKLYYFASVISNFGDDLNPWIWPRLLPEVFQNPSDDGLFVGIGTLLNSKLPSLPRMAIFSTGCGYGPVPHPISSTWKIYGVRGPDSARAMGLGREAAIGDGAILLRTLDLPPAQVEYPVSYMPHMESAILGCWPEACRQAGVHYIDPTGPVESILHQIRNSGRLISGAMHGTIVADAFRVPWTAVRPFHSSHLAKWRDWAGVLDVTFAFIELPATTPDEIIHDHAPWLGRQIQFMQRRIKPWPVTPKGKVNPSFPYPFVPDLIRGIFNPAAIDRAARALTKSLSEPVYQSSDAMMNRVTEGLLERLAAFRRDHADGLFSS